MTADASSGLQIATFDAPQDDRQPDFLIHDGCWLGDATALRGIVLPDQDEAVARGFLEMEAPCVYLGAAALRDSGIVERLARAYGPQRVGVFLPVARMEVSWSLETQSNADFKTLAPSHCEPAWEILGNDGGRTGTLVQWWLAAMFERGASSAIIRVDIHDDTDLNLCADLVERFGDKLWFAPRSAVGNRFDDWLRWGKATRLAVPIAVLDTDPDIRAWSAGEQEQAAA
jgi:hypothetical protein